MNRKDIDRMAKEAGWEQGKTWDDCPACGVFNLERFATLVASERDKHWHKVIHDECKAVIKEEREACAKFAEQFDGEYSALPDAIRARGQA